MNTLKSIYYAELNWKEQAKALFFVDHLRINEIADITRKARETISRYLCICDGYAEEMAFRKKASAEKSLEYKRNWDRDNRKCYMDVSGESLRREHEIAVRVLSAEKN